MRQFELVYPGRRDASRAAKGCRMRDFVGRLRFAPPFGFGSHPALFGTDFEKATRTVYTKLLTPAIEFPEQYRWNRRQM